jgi:hypothetical protein
MITVNTGKINMGKQLKPDVPTLIKRIIQEASLPDNEKDILSKFNRNQLVELYVYLSELKRSNIELTDKINQLNAGE